MQANTFIRSLSMNDGQSLRFDCPDCGGSNTLSVSQSHGLRQWQCFKAQCGVKGKERTARSVASIKDALLTQDRDFVKELMVPDYFTSVLSDESAMSYLDRMNSMDAYTSGKVDVRFDPKQRRVVFMVYHQGRIVDGIGRALDAERKPKWLRYANSGHPLIVGEDDTAVIVEDVPSACAVSSIATGVSLMGTSLQDAHLSALKGFKRALVCLDKDATKKSLAIQQYLSYFLPTVVRPLEDDLKYLKPDAVRAVLRLETLEN